MKNIGNCWWDFGEEGNVIIECTYPLVEGYPLITIHTPNKGERGEAHEAIEIAERVITLLKSQTIYANKR